MVIYTRKTTSPHPTTISKDVFEVTAESVVNTMIFDPLYLYNRAIKN